jgi:DNA invertase Pin-like site-specific DNA recombinase
MLAGPADDFTGRMFRALNSMMLDILAAIARKHYDDRRRRQAQGVAKAKAEGKYRGRPEDIGRNAGIASLLAGVEVAVGRRPGSIGVASGGPEPGAKPP